MMPAMASPERSRATGKHLVIFVALLFVVVLTGCVFSPSPAERRARADDLAAAQDWQSEFIPAGRFVLASYRPRHFRRGPLLTVYIEGDGFSWIDRTTPSADPTPRDPLGLRLALAQPSGNAAYLGRPCQYTEYMAKGRSVCPRRYWTEARFATEVVEATDEAINVLKERFGATRLVLVGYSGGGALAALLSARRKDVERLVTIAAPLDHLAWTHHHRVSPMSSSLNPADDAPALNGLSQTHFVGAHDRVVPPELARRWPQEFRGARDANLRVVPGHDHVCCWSESWKQFHREAMGG
jgi:predicted esterase